MSVVLLMLIVVARVVALHAIRIAAASCARSWRVPIALVGISLLMRTRLCVQTRKCIKPAVMHVVTSSAVLLQRLVMQSVLVCGMSAPSCSVITLVTRSAEPVTNFATEAVRILDVSTLEKHAVIFVGVSAHNSC